MILKGKFIVFEGIDGSGTTTQSKLLADNLKVAKHKVWWTKEPSDGMIGRILRKTLKGELPTEFSNKSMSLLFAADRLDHIKCEILPKLQRGYVVICDRYVLSSLAYQSLDNKLDWVYELNKDVIVPDLTFFLDVPVSEAETRRESRNKTERYDSFGIQSDVVARYHAVIDKYRNRLGTVYMIDGTMSIESVADNIMCVINKVFRDG